MAQEIALCRSPTAERSVAAADIRVHELYDSHFAFVWRNLRRLGVSELVLEDATQDVFLVVHRRLNSFDVRRSTVETWLFGILLRVAQGYRRSARRRWFWFTSDPAALSDDALASKADGPADHLAAREAAVLLDRLLDRLGEHQRAIFVSVDIEGLSVPEASAGLGWNINTAYWRLRSARLEFKRELARLRAKDPPNGGDRR